MFVSSAVSARGFFPVYLDVWVLLKYVIWINNVPLYNWTTDLVEVWPLTTLVFCVINWRVGPLSESQTIFPSFVISPAWILKWTFSGDFGLFSHSCCIDTGSLHCYMQIQTWCTHAASHLCVFSRGLSGHSYFVTFFCTLCILHLFGVDSYMTVKWWLPVKSFPTAAA